MARAAQTNNCNAVFFRLLQPQFYCFAADHLAEAIIAIRQRKRVVIQNDLHGSTKIQGPGLDPGKIARYAHHTVAIMARQVGTY